METIRVSIKAFIETCLSDGADMKVGVVARTTRLRDQLAKQLRDDGFKVSIVNHRQRLSRKDAQVFAMTLHRAKGLEFDGVVVVLDRDLDEHLRKLAYVGMTRAKTRCTIFSSAKLI